MKKILIASLIYLLAFQPMAQAVTWTTDVTQDGGGGDCEDGGECSVAEFNALTNDYSNSVFNFSGTITSQVDPHDSFGGTAGNPVILDGWSGGSYNATDGNRTNLASLAKLTASSGTGAMEIKGNDYITIRDFQFDGGDSAPVALLVWDTTGGDSAEYIKITDSYIHSYTDYGIWASTNNSGGADAVKYMTVGGASGDGVEIYDCSQSTSTHMTRWVDATEVIVSYNKVWNNDATRNYGTGGLTLGNSTQTQVTKFLFEYNYVAFNNYNTTGGEVGFGGKGKQEIIFRFNKSVNNIDDAQGMGFHAGYDSDQVYIYGNWFEGNHSGGGTSPGSSPWNTNSVDTTNIYVFSNIFWKNINEGLWSSEWGGATDNVDEVWFFNNTIFGNGTSPTASKNTGLRVESLTLDIRIRNNIIEDNRPNEADARQAHFADSFNTANLTFTHNRFYDPDAAAKVYYGASGEVSPSTVGSSNTVGDPGLTDPDGGDFTIPVGADVIGAGVDMGSGAIDTITIQGTAYAVNWDVGLGPNTDFSGSDPSAWTIDTRLRDTEGWDQGAYIYVDTQPIQGMSVTGQ